MKIFDYRCPLCGGVRLFTEAQHQVLEGLIGCELRERRHLREHYEPTPTVGGPPSNTPCAGALVLGRILLAEAA